MLLRRGRTYQHKKTVLHPRMKLSTPAEAKRRPSNENRRLLGPCPPPGGYALGRFDHPRPFTGRTEDIRVTGLCENRGPVTNWMIDDHCLVETPPIHSRFVEDHS